MSRKQQSLHSSMTMLPHIRKETSVWEGRGGGSGCSWNHCGKKDRFRGDHVTIENTARFISGENRPWRSGGVMPRVKKSKGRTKTALSANPKRIFVRRAKAHRTSRRAGRKG